METIKIIGFLAGALTTISFIPQVVKTVRTRDTGSLSLFMYLIFTAGVFFWLTYGILIKDVPIIIANGITCLLASTVLVYKLKFG